MLLPTNEWRKLDTIDLSSGALSYEFDTTGMSEIVMVVKETLDCATGRFGWKGMPHVSGGGDLFQKHEGATHHLYYIGGGDIAVERSRGTDNIQVGYVLSGAVDENNTLKITFAEVTTGKISIHGR